MAGRRVCLFGGTFDPIHDAHLKIASAALAQFSLERVIFIPAAYPPHKNTEGLTSFEDRFRMVEIACEPFPEFCASRLEEEEKKPSYTVDTLERYRRNVSSDDQLFFLIGADAFDELETWNRWRDVVKLTEFIVVDRPGCTFHLPKHAIAHRLSGLELPAASTAIRARLTAREPTPELPSRVRAFIEARHLYGT